MPVLLLLSANFVFYITFVQFGLLKMIDAGFGLSIASLGLPLALMSFLGALSSVATGFLIDRAKASLKTVFRLACILSVLEGVSALSSVALLNQGFLSSLFGLLGTLMGANGVLIIRCVETWPPERRGATAGYAMALVYLAVNLMAGLVPVPERIALLNGIMVAIAGVLCLFARKESDSQLPTPNAQLSFRRVVILLAALVAVDSFVFHLETNRPEIYRYTWEGRWLWNGIVHAIAAVAAGLLWDKKGEKPVFTVAIGSFALALLILIAFPIGAFTGFASTLFYNTAVSFYGIMIPIIWFFTASRLDVGLRIGIGMAITGWLASPLGIGFAMNALSVPASAAFSVPLVIIVFLFFNLPRIRRDAEEVNNQNLPPRH